MIYGICGWMSAGKDTIADYMAKTYGYKVYSFADPLKMAVGNIFNWDYVQLQGRTPEDRAKREVVDEWWSNKLGIPDFTQRKALQMIGTNCLRNHFSNEIWAAATIKRIKDDMNVNPDNNYAVPDCRFPNEIQLVRELGGKIIWVKRGPDPEWKETGYLASFGDEEAIKHLNSIGVHESEWRWMREVPDYVVDNHGTFDELYENVEKIFVKEDNMNDFVYLVYTKDSRFDDDSTWVLDSAHCSSQVADHYISKQRKSALSGQYVHGAWGERCDQKIVQCKREGVKLPINDDTDYLEYIRLEEIKKNALEKLTDEEKQLLNIHDDEI